MERNYSVTEAMRLVMGVESDEEMGVEAEEETETEAEAEAEAESQW